MRIKVITNYYIEVENIDISAKEITPEIMERIIKAINKGFRMERDFVEKIRNRKIRMNNV